MIRWEIFYKEVHLWIICKCSALDVFTDISLSDSKWLCFILFAWRDRKLLVNCLSSRQSMRFSFRSK